MPNFSLSNNLLVSKSVKSTLSPEEWKLDTHKHSTFMMNTVANYLNKRLQSSFNNGMSHDQIRSVMLGLMGEFRLYGANNKESVKVLDTILGKIFPKGTIHESEFIR